MNSTQNNDQKNSAQPQAIQINGFQQVLDLLRIADPAFRESLLKRLAAKDAKLAQTLRQDLKALSHR